MKEDELRPCGTPLGILACASGKVIIDPLLAGPSSAADNIDRIPSEPTEQQHPPNGPDSAYLCFVAEGLKSLKISCADKSEEEMRSILEKRWKDMPSSDREPYEVMASEQQRDGQESGENEPKATEPLLDPTVEYEDPCTGCGVGFGMEGRNRKRKMHPLLHVPVCNVCSETYSSGDFEVSLEDKHEIYCRWCGDGGVLCACDSCAMSFCTDCIERNVGKDRLAEILSEDVRWACFRCDDSQLAELRVRYNVKPRPGKKIRQRMPDSPVTSSLVVADERGNEGGRAVKRSKSNHEEKKKKSVQQLTTVVSEDLALGRENVVLPCVNDVDDAWPPSFTYVSKNMETESAQLNHEPSFRVCCDCTDGCRNPSKCACMQLSSGCPLSSYSSDGRLMENRVAVYECHSGCKCHNLCLNRVVGRGIQLPLEVFRCTPPEKGWGVRCREPVPSGTFVACYYGELLSEEAAEHRGKDQGDEYLFNLDLWALDVVDHEVKDALGQKVGYESHPTPVTSTNPGDGENGAVSMEDLKASAKEVLMRVEERADESDCDEQDGKKSLAKEDDGTRELPLPLPQDKSSDAEGVVTEVNGQVQPGPTDLQSTDLPPTDEKRPGGEMQEESDENETKEEKSPTEAAIQAVRDKAMTDFEGANQLLGIDAKWIGNVGRFFNHSCAPNMEKQAVFVEHHDVRVPHLALFTNCDVPANTELTYNYGYVKGSVEGKQMTCRCGEPNCVGRMY